MLRIRTNPSEQGSCIQLSALSCLSSLISLSVTGVGDSTAPSLASLSCLSKLQRLKVGDINSYPQPEHLQDAGLQQLTQLTQLTSLKFCAACLTPPLQEKMVAKVFRQERTASGQSFTMRTKVGILTASGWLWCMSEDVWQLWLHGLCALYVEGMRHLHRRHLDSSCSGYSH
jgi:hypothetical protein